MNIYSLYGPPVLATPCALLPTADRVECVTELVRVLDACGACAGVPQKGSAGPLWATMLWISFESSSDASPSQESCQSACLLI